MRKHDPERTEDTAEGDDRVDKRQVSVGGRGQANQVTQIQ